MDWVTSKKFFLVLGIALCVCLLLIAGLFGFQIFSLNQIVSQTQVNVSLVNQNNNDFEKEVKDEILVVSQIVSTENFSDYKTKLAEKLESSAKLIENTNKAKNDLKNGVNIDNQKVFTQANLVLSQRITYLQQIQKYLNLNQCVSDKSILLLEGSSELIQKWTSLQVGVSKEEMVSVSDATSKALKDKIANIKEFKSCFEQNLKELAADPDIDLASQKEQDLYNNLAGSLDKFSSSIKTNSTVDYQIAITSISKSFETKSEFIKSIASLILKDFQKTLGKLEESLKNGQNNFTSLVESYKEKYNYRGSFRIF